MRRATSEVVRQEPWRRGVFEVRKALAKAEKIRLKNRKGSKKCRTAPLKGVLFDECCQSECCQSERCQSVWQSESEEVFLSAQASRACEASRSERKERSWAQWAHSVKRNGGQLSQAQQERFARWVARSVQGLPFRAKPTLQDYLRLYR